MAQRILVIDDDLFIRELYSEVLKKGGFEADLAENGEEGLIKIHSGGYGLILLDMKMSPMDGLSVLEKLNEAGDKSKNGPIILLTNMELDDDVKKGMEKGALGHLVKADLTPDQLLEQISKFLPPIAPS